MYRDSCQYTFSNLLWCATDCMLWAELVHYSLQKALAADLHHFVILSFGCVLPNVQRHTCVKSEPHTGSCSGLDMRNIF